jgi:pimeloyl-ACP methyl ester carboxylesterase
MTIYFLSGLGADHRLFDALAIPSTYRIAHLHMPVPTRGQSMQSFAKQLATDINAHEDFILIGVSLGGMIATEISAFLKPRKVILISSAQCSNEIPAFYKLMGRLGVNNIIPGWLFKYSAFLLQGIYESDSWKHRKHFHQMLLAKPSAFYKRTVNMIVNWNRPAGNPEIIHIHGSGDRTLPVKLVKPHYVVERGSHMMVYTRAEDVNRILKEIL